MYRMVELNQHAIAGELRMLHQIAVVCHLGAENVRFMQHLQPMGCWLAHEHVGQRCAHFGAVDDSLRGADEAWVGNPFFVVQHLAQCRPAVAVVSRNHQPAILGLEGFVGSRVGCATADASRQLTIAQVTGDGRLLQCQRRVHQVDIQMAAQPIVLTGVQLGQYSHAGHVAGDYVHHWRLHFAGGRAWRSNQAHQSGICL
ncbi:hypothetical protein D3C84_745490 [compost metagenome]